ncbi:nucleotidyltransferase domain-containing protein [Micromonospora sp. DT4]|uniref:nucleotidyltransferase domain-containing protein n=1 Tax=Micromonospora sp. DT4 TaxID=3393438 RepID=UPI003CEC2776
MINELLADASRVLHKLVGTAGYGLVYGSHARGTASPQSDLDLLLITDEVPDRMDTAALVSEVRSLHARHGLDLDEEVAYEVKLFARTDEVIQAIALGGFVIDPSGRLSIPPVVAEPGFLNSTPFKLRLILNALTSPHIFLGGNVERYREHQAQASNAVALLALSMVDETERISITHLVHMLISDPGSGSHGKDYLGYASSDTAALHGLVQCGLAGLSTADATRAVDGVLVEQRAQIRRSLVARCGGGKP